MKTPGQKKKYRGVGFAARAALMAALAVGCFAMCCSFTHAWFITERGADENRVELATYGVTVRDKDGNKLDGLKYTCPLAQEDLHQFTLQAAGTAYTGHCTVGVTAPGRSEFGYVMELVPDQSGTVSLRAAEGSLLTFSFDWGEGEDPVEPAQAFGREDALLFRIEHSRTPHLLYEVAYGATPAGIAAYYGVSAEALCTYNGVDIGSASVPLYPSGDLIYAIPYADKHPVSGPYVPTGDLILTMNSAGDAVTPRNACVLVAGPNGYLVQLWYSDFVGGSYILKDLPAGEYRFTVGNVELENYTLETTGGMAASVGENAVTEHVIVNTYTRHVGEVMLGLKASDEKVKIPDDAKLIFYGPDSAVFEAYWYQFNNGTLWLKDLPTGQYTVVLSGAEVKSYDLIAVETVLTVNKDQTTYTELTAEYTRQIGDLEIRLTAEGHEIGADAIVAVYGQDGIYGIPYAWFVDDCFKLEDLPAGEYVVKLETTGVDRFDLFTDTVGAVVKKDETVHVDVFARYRRHVGDLAIAVEVFGAQLPAEARLMVVGPDGYSKILNCESTTLGGLPTGIYIASVQGADLEGYTVAVTEGTAEVTKNGGGISVSVAYTAVAAEPDEDAPDEEAVSGEEAASDGEDGSNEETVSD